MGDSTKKRKMKGRPRRPNVTHRSSMRDTDYMKPPRFADYLTITEMSRAVDRDISWLRKLERDGKIPKAHRVPVGKLMVRLWSPTQRDEILVIVNSLKRGRPPGR
jgi:hypothetical protein